MKLGVLGVFCFSFQLDIPAIMDRENHFIAITWTNEGGVFELIIDGILQSSVTGIEKDGKISGQTRFIIGGNELEMKNLYVTLYNLNVWDKVGLVRLFFLLNRRTFTV